MFGLFRKASSPRVDVVDKVWMSTEAKALACAQMQEADPSCLFVAWFEETFDHVKEWISPEINNEVCLCLATDPAVLNGKDRMIVFVEHYPLSGMEQQLFSKLGKNEIPVLSALDEPLFGLFGGGRIVGLMKKLGMKEDEMIGHSMVSKSINNAQRKIANHIKVEKRARSPKEWFEINYKK